MGFVAPTMEKRIVHDDKEKYDLIYKGGRKRKVLLINPPQFLFSIIPKRGLCPKFYPALLRIGQFLKDNGSEVKLIDCVYEFRDVEKDGFLKCGNYEEEKITKNKFILGVSFGTIRKRMAKEGPFDEIYIGSLFTYYYKYVHKVIDICKELFPDVPVYLGGVYASLCPEHALKSKADKIIVGEIREINNYKLALELLNKIPPKVVVQYTRGCPNNCSYCAVPKLEGRKTRYACIKTVIERIKHYYEKFGIINFVMWGSNILINCKENFSKLLDEIISLKYKDINFFFPDGFQLNLLTQDVASKLKKINTKHVTLALETVDPGMNKRFHRATKLSDLEECVVKFKKAGFHNYDLSCLVLMGFPGQSCKSIIETVAFVCKVGCSFTSLCFTPIPGTEEYDKCKHLIKDKDFEELHPYIYPFASSELKVEFLEELMSFKGPRSIFDVKSDGPMAQSIRETILKDDVALSIPELENADLAGCPVFHLRFKQDELNNDSWKQIISFIEKLRGKTINFLISKPIPKSVVPEGEYKNFCEALRHNMPSGCRNCLHKHGCNLMDKGEQCCFE